MIDPWMSKFRHDPLHELIEERHSEGRVAVGGTIDHSFGDQAALAGWGAWRFIKSLAILSKKAKPW